jgi:hypothetical protein
MGLLLKESPDQRAYDLISFNDTEALKMVGTLTKEGGAKWQIRR